MCLAYWIGKGERLKWDGFHSCTMISSTNSMFLEKPRCLAGETVEQLGDSYSPLHSPMQVDQGAKGTWVRWFRQNHNVCIDQTKRRSDEEAIRRKGDQRKRWSDEGAIRRKGKIGKTTMSGSSSRTVHCPCGRVSECTGAETFLQHDAHPAASAPLPLFLNIFSLNISKCLPAVSPFWNMMPTRLLALIQLLESQTDMRRWRFDIRT